MPALTAEQSAALADVLKNALNAPSKSFNILASVKGDPRVEGLMRQIHEDAILSVGRLDGAGLNEATNEEIVYVHARAREDSAKFKEDQKKLGTDTGKQPVGPVLNSDAISALNYAARRHVVIKPGNTLDGKGDAPASRRVYWHYLSKEDAAPKTQFGARVFGPSDDTAWEARYRELGGKEDET